MVKLYMNRILSKKMTLSEVPERWRAEVAALLQIAGEAPGDSED